MKLWFFHHTFYSLWNFTIFIFKNGWDCQLLIIRHCPVLHNIWPTVDLEPFYSTTRLSLFFIFPLILFTQRCSSKGSICRQTDTGQRKVNINHSKRSSENNHCLWNWMCGKLGWHLLLCYGIGEGGREEGGGKCRDDGGLISCLNTLILHVVFQVCCGECIFTNT